MLNHRKDAGRSWLSILSDGKGSMVKTAVVHIRGSKNRGWGPKKDLELKTSGPMSPKLFSTLLYHSQGI